MVAGTVAVAGIATGLVSAAILFQADVLVTFWRNGRTLVRVRVDDGEVFRFKRPDLWSARLHSDADGRTMLLDVRDRRGDRGFRGEEAERIAGVLIARMNAMGARQPIVQRAVSSIDAAGGSNDYLVRLLKLASTRRGRWAEEPGAIEFGRLEPTGRLALEMALHEEQERRALDGELAQLEQAWRDAEEIARIADELLLPEGVSDWLARHREAGAGVPRTT